MEAPRQRTAISGTAVGSANLAEGEAIEMQDRNPKNPFLTPYGSMPASAVASTSSFQKSAQSMRSSQGTPNRPRYFHSRRIVKGNLERPWLKNKDPREKWVNIIPICGIIVGLILTGFLVWDGLQTVQKHNYCSVYETDFSKGLDEDVWTREVEVGGFGNGQFEMTTGTAENAFVKDGVLILKPTLQDAELIENNNIINLTKQGICSSDLWSNCVAATNTTNGTIVNPVKSARINTKRGATIKYGRVEVEARLPAGEWLWPAIWMLPVKDTYGPWPASGEVDIMESRGNHFGYPQGGNNIVSSTLHWGPDPDNDQWWQINNKREALHTTYSTGFHKYGMEWSEKYIFTYIDTRLMQVLYTSFDKPFWTKADWPPSDANGTRLVDPWSQTGRSSTPFDQDFYLILNVAVGGTNGWFEDGIDGKPWVDGSDTAKRDFWRAKGLWYPTWEKNGQMEVKSVKIFQQGGYNGCPK